MGASSEVHRILSFREPGEIERWFSIDDGVMGGVSSSRLHRAADGEAVFAGAVSLENNGGFASVRRGEQALDLGAFDGLLLRVRGDGKRYSVRLRTQSGFDGVVYQAKFDTGDGVWQEIEVPFDRFSASFRGRPVPEAGPLDRSSIRSIGFMIADGQEGRFALAVDTVSAYRRARF